MPDVSVAELGQSAKELRTNQLPLDRWFDSSNACAQQLITAGRGDERLLSELGTIKQQLQQRLTHLGASVPIEGVERAVSTKYSLDDTRVPIAQLSPGAIEALLKGAQVVPEDKTYADLLIEVRRQDEIREHNRREVDQARAEKRQSQPRDIGETWLTRYQGRVAGESKFTAVGVGDFQVGVNFENSSANIYFSTGVLTQHFAAQAPQAAK